MFGDIVKMTQASAQTRDEAEELESLGIDLITIADLDIDEIRDGAPNTFVGGSQTMVQYVTEDDALAAAIRVASLVTSLALETSYTIRNTRACGGWVSRTPAPRTATASLANEPVHTAWSDLSARIVYGRQPARFRRRRRGTSGSGHVSRRSNRS